MIVPLAPLDLDFATAPADGVPVPPRFRRARVLARWSGVPLAIVEVPVREDRIRTEDVLRAVRQQDAAAIPREAARRALLFTGLGERLAPAGLAATSSPRRVSPVSAVSVVVCTRDRPDDLAVCLDALAALDPAPGEILIVDNAPATDATARLVARRSAPFRYVCEPRPGLDHARNRAIAETRGDIIAFTDDDVAVDPRWVGAIADAMAEDPSVGLVTGLVEPLELETRAQLLFERYGGFGRGCRRLYSQAPRSGRMPWTLVGAGQLGAGASMALRRDVLRHVGGFDPALDVGTPTLGGGDHDIFFRVLQAGYLCVYDPMVIARHRHRRTVAELRRLLYSYGHATRCLFDRETRNFPADEPAIRRLRRWWWRHWAVGRWWRARMLPGWFPTTLVRVEIAGFVAGRGVYVQARRTIVPDETRRPDAPPARTVRPVGRPGAVGVFALDVTTPLTALDAARDYDSITVVVQWRGRPIGSIHLANHGQPVSARRLADEIARTHWHRLIALTETNEAAAFTRFADEFAAAITAPATSVPRRPTLVSIVVATCNRPAALRRCLESLQALETSRPRQIIVVDNRPGAGDTAAVVRAFPGVELVTEPRSGSSYARNTGVAAARGDLVTMVDDDMRVAPGWLEALLAPFDRTDVVAVTGNTLPALLDTPAERLLESYGGFCRGFHRREFDRAWFNRNRWRAVPTWQIGGSGNLAFRREIFAWRRIGRFAETLGAGVPTGVGEDTKLFYDILAAGFAIIYEPAAVAWHYHRATMTGLRKQLYAYSKGHVAYHLTTLAGHGDLRALVRLAFELPQAYAARAWARLRRRSPFPLGLLLIELAGTLAGPWSLWRAHRLARRIERARDGTMRPSRRGATSWLARKRPVAGVQP